MLAVVLMTGMQFSCSNDEDQDLSVYKKENNKIYATGGEDGQIPPPPLPPPPSGEY